MATLTLRPELHGLAFRHTGPGCMNGAATRAFSAEEVEAWGLVDWFGDNRTFLIARLRDGWLVEVRRSHQDEAHRPGLDTLAKRIRKQHKYPCEDCGRLFPTRDNPGVIRWEKI
jgi:hypothetical protein